MKYIVVTFLLSVICGCSAILNLPSYIRPCKPDNNLNKCAKESGNEAIKTLVKGDAKYKIPKLNPIVLPRIDVESGPNLKISLTDLAVHGLENCVIEDIKIDLENRILDIKLSTDHLKLDGHYTINGRILVLPIEGNGKALMTFGPSKFHAIVKYDLADKKGRKYIVNIKPDVKYEISQPFYHFDNLFNGDKQLGDHMNKFLNDNADEVHKELSPAVSQTITSVVLAILNGIFQKVPYDTVFPQ